MWMHDALASSGLQSARPQKEEFVHAMTFDRNQSKASRRPFDGSSPHL